MPQLVIRGTVDETYEVRRGDTVSYVGTYDGVKTFQAAPVVAVDEKTVTVFTRFGTHEILPLDGGVKLSNDQRSQRLREADKNTPDVAEDMREEYVVAWIASHTPSEDEQPVEGAPVVQRRRFSRKAETSQASQVIFDYIREAKFMVSRDDILKATEVSIPAYVMAMRSLKAQKVVVQVGDKRGARYGVKGKDYAERPKAEVTRASTDPDVSKHVEKVVKRLKKRTPSARADLIDLVPENVWVYVARALKNDERVVVTGNRRSTRYALA